MDGEDMQSGLKTTAD